LKFGPTVVQAGQDGQADGAARAAKRLVFGDMDGLFPRVFFLGVRIRRISGAQGW
jgi:hypothetical protein